jgi:dTDP-4-dehydrorhamnose reductase
MPTRVLVLGCTGMLGHMVLRTLQATVGLDVQGSHRASEAGGLHFDAGSGSPSIRELLQHSGGFDYLINCIAVTNALIDERDADSTRQARAINGRFPHQLAAATAELGGKVIHVSTDGVFPIDAGACFEDTDNNPHDFYAETKVAGELFEPHTITLRTSIVGPDPVAHRGLLEWLLSQPDGSEVSGYSDFLWSGVTTLQFAELCRDLILSNAFPAVRAESALHHYCPNPPVSKYELLLLFAEAFGKSVTVRPVEGPPPRGTRTLGTRYNLLKQFYGERVGLDVAVGRLSSLST